MSFIRAKDQTQMAALLKGAVEVLHAGPVMTTDVRTYVNEAEFTLYLKEVGGRERKYRITVEDLTEEPAED